MAGRRATDAAPLMLCARCGRPTAAGFRLLRPSGTEGDAPFCCGGCLAPEDPSEPAAEADYLAWVLDRFRAVSAASLASRDEARSILRRVRERGLATGVVELAAVRDARARLAGAERQVSELDAMRLSMLPLLAARGLLGAGWKAWSAAFEARLRA